MCCFFFGFLRIGCYFVLFFFSSRRRHTRSLCDWSSDVCSSDLEFADEAARTLQQRDRHRRLTSLGVPLAEIAFDADGIDEAALFSIADQIRNQIPLEVDE